MVQSKGTRPDSHLFKMDLTGSRKYSGRSSDLRSVGAAGEMEARRAMPTSDGEPSGTASCDTAVSFRKPCEVWTSCPHAAGETDGGQSECLFSATTLPEPESWASSEGRWFGLLRPGLTGKSEAEENGARRRIGYPAARLEEVTGNIAHLYTGGVFRFLFALSRRFVFCLPLQFGADQVAECAPSGASPVLARLANHLGEPLVLEEMRT